MANITFGYILSESGYYTTILSTNEGISSQAPFYDWLLSADSKAVKFYASA